MPKEVYREEVHQDYPDPRPSHEARMKAFAVLLGQEPEIFQQAEVSEEKEVKSMPSIYERVKRLGFQETSSGDRRRILAQMAKIQETKGEKEAGLAMLEELDLPRYSKIKTTIAEFLKDPDYFLQQIPEASYFPSVTNRDTGERYFSLDLNKKEVLKFLRQMLKKRRVSENDLLILSEYQVNAYSGNIIINPPTSKDKQSSERISIELVEGAHAGLAYEGSLPLIRSKDNWFNRLEFEVLVPSGLSERVKKALSKLTRFNKSSYVDFKKFQAAFDIAGTTEQDREILAYYEQLFKVLVEVVGKIPKDLDKDYHFSVDGRAHHPGYYEFILNEDLQVYFLDYREARRYSDLQANLLETEDVA